MAGSGTIGSMPAPHKILELVSRFEGGKREIDEVAFGLYEVGEEERKLIEKI